MNRKFSGGRVSLKREGSLKRLYGGRRQNGKRKAYILGKLTERGMRRGLRRGAAQRNHLPQPRPIFKRSAYTYIRLMSQIS